MKCNKCGNVNAAGVNFCVSCGNKLEAPKGKATKVATKENANINVMDYFQLIVSAIVKPGNFIKEKVSKLANIKDSAIIAAAIGFIITVISLLKTMITTVFYKNIFSGSISFDIERLGSIPYFKTIFLGLLINIGISFVIAGIYYVAGLILKKTPNYSKMVGTVAIGLIPYFVVSTVIAPIFGLIHFNLQIIIAIAGLMYSLAIIYEGLNEELKLEDDKKIYVNAACMTILLVCIYLIGYNMIMSAVSSSLSSSFNIFK